MPTPRPETLDFLLTRRSRPFKTLSDPVPTDAELRPLLTAAARTPDHGALVPFRFIVLKRVALQRIAEMIPATGARLERTQEDIAKQQSAYALGRLAVAVISVPKPGKIPEIEQSYTAGAVCLALLNAALAAGWGANWLSGWASHDARFRADAFGLAPQERIAGIIHIGTETAEPPDRPRPDVDALTSWVTG